MMWNTNSFIWAAFPETENNFDISVIVNTHREGLLCLPSIKSAFAAAKLARFDGLTVELIVALDCADDMTRDIVEDARKKGLVDTVLHLNVHDLGGARNFSVGIARGKWIAFLDADDLWSENWLAAAYRHGEGENRVTVWHPELNIYFGEQWRVFRHIDMDDPSFNVSKLALQNCWTALAFTQRSLLSTVQYPATDLQNQIGYEDWGWNLRCIETGALHKIVRGTSHGIRLKRESLVKKTLAANAVPASSLLFRRILAERALLHSKTYASSDSPG